MFLRSILIFPVLFVISIHGELNSTLLGSTVVLSCESISRADWYGPYDGGSVEVTLGFNNMFSGELRERIFTSGNKLFISNIQPSDEGIYKCSDGEEIVSTFNLSIPALMYSSDKQYFRHVEVDILMKKLLVGSMNKISVIDLSPPMKKISKNIPANRNNVDNCVLSHTRTPYCQNHIRLLAKVSDTIWKVCGTNGGSPTGYQFNITGGFYEETESVPCSNDPFHSSTAVFVEPLQSGGRPHIYYGSVYYSDRTIQRPIYNTAGSIREYMKGVDSNNWMKNPEFIGSFELNDTVLFFFREEAVEVDQKNPRIYSRVAKVCKKDKGGNTQLRNKWTSFQKARLTCSTHGKYPFYFDVLQDVVTADKVTFYALFTSSGISASAICAYTLSNIEQVFSGQFMYQPNPSSYWKPVPDIPSPRPGQCSDDSLTLPDATLEFIANRPLMYENVPPKSGKPIFVMEKENLKQFEIHRNIKELVFYVASNQGVIYKLFSKNSKTYIVSSFKAKQFGKSDAAIWSIKQFGEHVYIGTDHSVQAVQVINCDQYRSINSCIKDPHCAWINNTYPIPNDQCYNRCRSLAYVTESGYLDFSYTYTNSDLSDLQLSCPPETPLHLGLINVSSSSITIKWTLSKGNNQTIVILYRIRGSSWESVKFNSFINNRYTIKELTPEILYEVKIYSTNSVGNSSISESIFVATLPFVEESTDVLLPHTERPINDVTQQSKTTVSSITEFSVHFSKGSPPVKAAQSGGTNSATDQDSWKHAFISLIVLGALYYLGFAIVLAIANWRKQYAQTGDVEGNGNNVKKVKSLRRKPDGNSNSLLSYQAEVRKLLSSCYRGSYDIRSNENGQENGVPCENPDEEDRL